MQTRSTLLATTLVFAAMAIPASAGSYTVTCTNTYSNETVKVKNVSASSQAAAAEKVRNDPQYGELENCK